MVQLTETQRAVACFILERISNAGVPPTLREIAAHFGWRAVGSAQDVVLALRKKGLLQQQDSGKARQLIPDESAWNVLGLEHPNRLKKRFPRAKAAETVESHAFAEGFLVVPMLGFVQAGAPHEAIEEVREHVTFPVEPGFRRDASKFFALVISGYSMLHAGFMPGDCVLVERVTDAGNGDIVVAKVDSEVTVKRFAVKGSYLYRQAIEKIPARPSLSPPALLVPENPDFEPIAFGNDESHAIVGLVRSLWRRSV